MKKIDEGAQIPVADIVYYNGACFIVALIPWMYIVCIVLVIVKLIFNWP